MKTDRFSDIIRRKLESIRPEFSEKDWARMQSTLHNANMPQPGSTGTGQSFTTSIWSSHPWMMAAATISTVALITVGVWQRREINELRQMVGQLNKQQLTQPDQKPTDHKLPDNVRSDLTNANGLHPRNSEESTVPSRKIDRQSVRPDTVYVNRYVAVPSPTRSQSELPAEATSKQRTESLPLQRYATTNRQPASTDIVRENQPSTTKTAPYDVTSTSDKDINNERSVTKVESANQPENERTASDRIVPGKNTDGQVSERLNGKSQVASRLNERNQTSGRPNDKSQAWDRETVKNRDRKPITTYPTNTIDSPNNDVAKTTTAQPESSAEASGLSTRYELVSGLPLSTRSLNWNALLAQRAKRMQPARVTLVQAAPVQVAEQKKAPESQPINRAAVRLRAGVGGEMALRLWSAGVFTETLIGKHLTVGLGLSQATYNTTFINDYEFDVKTRRDFRKEFGNMVDPRRDILNIDTKATRLQIPVSLGYRIPITQTLSILPTVGTSLNLKTAEDVTFYCPLYFPKGRFDQFSQSVARPVDLINTVAFGAGLEWQRHHWVVQTSPVLTLPMQVENDPNWQNKTTLGLRARVLFQF